MKNKPLLLLLALLANSAAASTGYYVVVPYPNAGEAAVDFKYWNAKPSGKPPRDLPEIGLAYNVNARWYTEVSVSWFRMSPGSEKLAAIEWQNDVMLTQGQYPVDIALHSVVERDQSDHAVGLEFGPVLQTEFGPLQVNLNLFFQRELRVTPAESTELAYQWQLRYHGNPALQFGAQGFGEVGTWNDWLPRKQQSHRAGPALFGSVPMGAHQMLRYEAAYLIGTNSARNAKSVTMRVQYAF
jgi:hypothetical protein